MALLKSDPKSLEERIKGVRAEAAAYIDAATHAEITRMGGGVPFLNVRVGITGGRDDLDAYLYLKEQAA
jgi:hypothetical protein